MRKVTLNASVYVRLQKERQMLKKIVRYPVVRSEIRTFSFDGRATQWEKDNVFVGRFSDRVMVGLLHSNAFNGDLGRLNCLKTIPFTAEHTCIAHNNSSESNGHTTQLRGMAST